MKKSITVLFAATISFSAFAHNGEDHSQQKTPQAPDCAKMASMKMNPNDPVMQAMHAKCANPTHKDHDAKPADDSKPHGDDKDAHHDHADTDKEKGAGQ
jgi:hypothetical protein